MTPSPVLAFPGPAVAAPEPAAAPPDEGAAFCLAEPPARAAPSTRAAGEERRSSAPPPDPVPEAEEEDPARNADESDAAAVLPDESLVASSAELRVRALVPAPETPETCAAGPPPPIPREARAEPAAAQAAVCDRPDIGGPDIGGPEAAPPAPDVPDLPDAPDAPPPLFTAGPHSPAPPDRPGLPAAAPAVVQQMVAAALKAADGPEAELTLTPEGLGNLRIGLSAEGDRITMTLSAERADTLDLMRRHLADLTAELQAAGFVQVDLGFADWAPPDAPAPTEPAAPDPATPAATVTILLPPGNGTLFLRI